MATAEKFSFGEDFDAPEPTLPKVEEDPDFVEEEIVVAPTFSEEEMAAARAAGREEGRAEAVREAQESIDLRIADSLATIREHLAAMGEALTTSLRERERDAVVLAATIARKIVPEVARHGAVEALEAFVAECMEKVRDEPRLVIRVNDAVAEPLRARMGDIAVENGYPGDVAVLSDNEIPVTDCHIEWGEGGTDFQAHRIWSEMDDLIQSFLDSYAHQGKPEPASDAENPAPGGETPIGD